MSRLLVRLLSLLCALVVLHGRCGYGNTSYQQVPFLSIHSSSAMIGDRSVTLGAMIGDLETVSRVGSGVLILLESSIRAKEFAERMGAYGTLSHLPLFQNAISSVSVHSDVFNSVNEHAGDVSSLLRSLVEKMGTSLSTLVVPESSLLTPEGKNTFLSVASSVVSAESFLSEKMRKRVAKMLNQRGVSVIVLGSEFEKYDAFLAEIVSNLVTKQDSTPFVFSLTSQLALSPTVSSNVNTLVFSESKGTRASPSSATTDGDDDDDSEPTYMDSYAMNGILVTIMLASFILISIRCLFSIEPQDTFAEEEKEEKQ